MLEATFWAAECQRGEGELSKLQLVRGKTVWRYISHAWCHSPLQLCYNFVAAGYEQDSKLVEQLG